MRFIDLSEKEQIKLLKSKSLLGFTEYLKVKYNNINLTNRSLILLKKYLASYVILLREKNEFLFVLKDQSSTDHKIIKSFAAEHPALRTTIVDIKKHEASIFDLKVRINNLKEIRANKRLLLKEQTCSLKTYMKFVTGKIDSNND